MIRGTKTKLGPTADFNARIHNRFDVEVIDVLTGKVRQRAQAENIICNSLWTALNTTSYFSYIHYGTGSGTPAVTDTSLFNYLGGASAGSAVYTPDLGSGIISCRKSIQLSESAAVGATLTEVGIASGSGSSTLVTHAMLKDMNGNQISINKTNTDIINIYATVFVHVPSIQNQISSGIFFNLYPTDIIKWLLGDTSTKISQTACYGSYGICHDPGGNTSALSSASAAFNVTSKILTVTHGRFAAGIGNYSKGLCALFRGNTYFENFLSNEMSYTVTVFGNAISNSQITGETIGTGNGSTKDFSTKFDFVQAGAKVYVNGVEMTSGVTVDIDKPSINGTNMGLYFALLSGFSVCPTPINLTSNGSTDGLTYAVYYNPLHALGISSYKTASQARVDVSDDLINWVTISNQVDGTHTVPAEYRNYKFWKIYGYSASQVTNNSANTFTCATTITAANIHFDTAPASGAVITADYATRTIAKDANHVFDLTVTIQLGEFAS